MIKSVLKMALWALIAWGVIRGVVRYNNATDGDGIARVLTAIVGGISDATYRLIPAIIDTVGQLSGAGGGS